MYLDNPSLTVLRRLRQRQYFWRQRLRQRQLYLDYPSLVLLRRLRQRQRLIQQQRLWLRMRLKVLSARKNKADETEPFPLFTGGAKAPFFYIIKRRLCETPVSVGKPGHIALKRLAVLIFINIFCSLCFFVFFYVFFAACAVLSALFHTSCVYLIN